MSASCLINYLSIYNNRIYFTFSKYFVCHCLLYECLRFVSCCDLQIFALYTLVPYIILIMYNRFVNYRCVHMYV